VVVSKTTGLDSADEIVIGLELVPSFLLGGSSFLGGVDDGKEGLVENIEGPIQGLISSSNSLVRSRGVTFSCNVDVVFAEVGGTPVEEDMIRIGVISPP
jgi:hypothetical protein